MVGHSLGAHIAGRTAKFLQQLSRPIGRIACIIGLDPASFGFKFLKPEKRLSHDDADYVQVIHTDGSKFGLPFPIGHGTVNVIYQYFNCYAKIIIKNFHFISGLLPKRRA